MVPALPGILHCGNENNLVSETDASGQVIAYYTWDSQGRPVSVTKNGQTYYFDLNAHGDVINLAGGSYSYDPWDKVLLEPTTGPGADNPIRYAGYYFDKETGLYYLRARYYNPDIKRFLTIDPDTGDQRDPQSGNLYSYCGNNPIIKVDPTGEWGWLVWAAAQAALDWVWVKMWVQKKWFTYVRPWWIRWLVGWRGRVINGWDYWALAWNFLQNSLGGFIASKMGWRVAKNAIWSVYVNVKATITSWSWGGWPGWWGASRDLARAVGWGLIGAGLGRFS